MDDLNRRKRKYDNLQLLGIVLTVFGGVFLFAARVSVSVSPVILVLAIGLGGPGLIITGIARSEIKKISNEFKSTYVKKEIEKLIPGAHYNPLIGVSRSTVERSRLVKLHDVFKSEDLIQGEIQDVGFTFSDVHVIDIQRSGKHTRRVTTFKGRFYIFDFNKRFRSDLLLLQPGQYRPFSSLNKIKLESVQFNSEFKIYAGNEHEAFYILTPHFMEKLLELDRKYYDKIGFSFQHNKLFIAIDSRTDSFDVLGAGDITVKHVNDAIIELERLIEFVTYLKLDNKLFIPVDER